MLDTNNPENSFLFKLSNEEVILNFIFVFFINQFVFFFFLQIKGLNWFKNIFLVSSQADLYAPYHSARIEIVDKKN